MGTSLLVLVLLLLLVLHVTAAPAGPEPVGKPVTASTAQPNTTTDCC